MKKTLFGSVTVLVAAGVFGQGTINFNTRFSTVVTTHVYAPLSSDPALHQTGNGSNDLPSGTGDWSGFAPIGASGTSGQYGAATVFAQLLGASGYNQSEASLQPGLGITTFRTGIAAGSVVAVTATLVGVAPNSPEATVEMVAWDNSSGLYSTWTQAFPAWQAGVIAAGKSGPWNQDGFDATGPSPPMINSADPSQHVSSFNLYFTPEPSALTLAGLGATLLLLWRPNARKAGTGRKGPSPSVWSS